MERIYTYDKKNSERVVTLSQNSGLYFASISDEIGITHEYAEGEVAETNNDE